MTAAEELRAAASRLRERAAKTEQGLAAALREGTRDLFGTPVVDPAVMHAPVALALAAWLETEAETWAGDEVHNRCSPTVCTLDAALAVARAL